MDFDFDSDSDSARLQTAGSMEEVVVAGKVKRAGKVDEGIQGVVGRVVKKVEMGDMRGEVVQ